MRRREFIKTSIGAGIAASTAITLGTTINIKAQAKANKETYDLVAVKDGEPEEMFDKAIEAMGGLHKFVKKGNKVVVKPNIGWDAIPERGANTNPKLVERIVLRCYEAGAKEVLVFDNTCNEWTKCYENSGIKKAVEKVGGKMVPANTESYYKEVQVNGKILKSTKEHVSIQSSDVFINVPVLKHHGSAKLSIAMKNLMGIMWDRRWWHKNDLHQCIADFAAYRKPTLNVVDAYRVMKTNGPRGVSESDCVILKSLLVSQDIVAVDVAAAKIFGIDPETVDYITIAANLKVGHKDLDNLKIKRITI